MTSQCRPVSSCMVLFVLGFYVPLENFRSYDQWRASNVDLYSALVVIEQWMFFSVPHLLWQWGIRLKWSSPRTLDTHTYWRTFDSGAVTICFYYLGLSWLGFEHPTFCLRCERSYRLHLRGGSLLGLKNFVIAGLCLIQIKFESSTSAMNAKNN